MEGYKVTDTITKIEKFFTSDRVAAKHFGDGAWEDMRLNLYAPYVVVEKILPEEILDDEFTEDMDARR
jgi:hypothetical protein